MIMLEFDEILLLHEKLIEKTGGIKGVRDYKLLKSALENPFQTFNNQELYIKVEEKIAVLTYSIINNHPMIDGNKRLGVSLLGILCKLNKIELVYNQTELVELGLGIAQNKIKKDEIVNWINVHIKRR